MGVGGGACDCMPPGAERAPATTDHVTHIINVGVLGLPSAIIGGPHGKLCFFWVLFIIIITEQSTLQQKTMF